MPKGELFKKSICSVISFFGLADDCILRKAAFVFCAIMAFCGQTYSQIQREYVYLNDRILATEAQPLPGIWENTDIGSVGLAGSASYLGGTYTVMGSGADIWGAADAFQFAYIQSTGNMTITARVVSQTNTDPWARAGVMIRNGTGSNVAHAFTAITPSNGLDFVRRTTAGGTSTRTAGPSGSVPYWVRLQRSGSTFTSYVSTNGTSWTTVGSVSITMASSVYVGLAVTAHNNAAICTVTFDNVTITSP
jgi:regulation of enolase protein 1 (concanavalin A-like superfamily)